MAKDKDDIAISKASDSSDILFSWWKHILLQCRITDMTKYGRLVAQWINNPIYGIPKDPKRQSTYRGNLNKEHWRGTMTWKVWLKALSVIGVDRIDFTIRLHRSQHTDTPVLDVMFTIDNLPNYVANLIKEEPEPQVTYTPTTKRRVVTKAPPTFIDPTSQSYSQISKEVTTAYATVNYGGHKTGVVKESK